MLSHLQTQWWPISGRVYIRDRCFKGQSRSASANMCRKRGQWEHIKPHVIIFVRASLRVTCNFYIIKFVQNGQDTGISCVSDAVNSLWTYYIFHMFSVFDVYSSTTTKPEHMQDFKPHIREWEKRLFICWPISCSHQYWAASNVLRWAVLWYETVVCNLWKTLKLKDRFPNTL